MAVALSSTGKMEVHLVNPDDGNRFVGFSITIALDRKWHELACHVCGANTPKSGNTEFFFPRRQVAARPYIYISRRRTK